MPSSDAGRLWLAVAAALASIVGFDSMAIFSRLLSERGYVPIELSVYRNLFGVIPSLILMAWMGELSFSRKAYQIARWKLALGRGVAVSFAQLCYYTALARLELATVSSLMQSHALFVVLLSVVLLREKVGPWRIFAVIFGLLGVLWVLRPGSDSFSLAAILPVGAAFGYAFSIVSVRLFDKSISNGLLYVYSAAASATTSLVVTLLSTGFSPIASMPEFFMILAMAMSGGCAVLLLMLAYRMAAPSVLAPLNYLGILTAFGFGFVIFGESPVQTLFPGVILIVVAGSLIIWREQFVKRRQDNRGHGQGRL